MEEANTMVIPQVPLLGERLVESSSVQGSFLCRLTGDKTHVAVRRGGALSVMEVRGGNALVPIARAQLSQSVLFAFPLQPVISSPTGPSPSATHGGAAMNVSQSTTARPPSTAGWLGAVLSDGSVVLLALDPVSNQLQLLSAAEMPKLLVASTGVAADLSSAVFAFDEHRSAVIVFAPQRPEKRLEEANGKRYYVVEERPPLVWLLQFALDFFPDLHARCEAVNWTHLWCPSKVVFLNTKNTWSLSCVVEDRVKTFSINADARGSPPDLRELKLTIEPPRKIDDILFLEGTFSLVSMGSDVCLFAGSKLLQVLMYDRAVSFVRFFPLRTGNNANSPVEVICALSDGTLQLIRAVLSPQGQEQLSSLPLGESASQTVPSTITHVATVAFKQGPCHLIYIGCKTGDSSVSFLVPSNPKRRLQHVSTTLGTAPISSLVMGTGSRLYAAFGKGSASGLASVKKWFQFRSLFHFAGQKKTKRAFFLQMRFIALVTDTGETRLVRIDRGQKAHQAEEELRLVEESTSFPGGTESFFAVNMSAESALVRVTEGGEIFLLSRDFRTLDTTTLKEPVVSVLGQSESFFVVLKNGVMKHFRVVDGQKVHDLGSHRMPDDFRGNRNHVICVGPPHMLIAVSKGALVADSGKFGATWENFPVRSLRGRQVVAMGTLMPRTATSPYTLVALLCVAGASEWHLVVFPFWLQTTDYSVTDAEVFLCSMPAAQVDVASVQIQGYSDRGANSCFFVRLGPKHVFVVSQSGVGSWSANPSRDNLYPLASCRLDAERSLVALVSESTVGLFFGFYPHVEYLVDPICRHSSSILFVTFMKRMGLLVAVDDQGRILCVNPDAPGGSVTIPYEMGNVVVSDLESLESGSAALLAVAHMPRPVVENDEWGCMKYHLRRVVFLSFRRSDTGVIFVSQSPAHHPVEIPSIGGCQVRVRRLPFINGGFAVAFDSYLQVLSFEAGSPAARKVWGVSLGADLSANDLLSTMSVQGNFITLLYMFGSVAVLRGTPDGQFSLHRQTIMPNRCDGPPAVMLSADVALAADDEGVVVLSTTDELHLKSVFSIPLNGRASTSIYHEGVAFFGTTRGEVVAFRAVPAGSFVEAARGNGVYLAEFGHCLDGNVLRASISFQGRQSPAKAIEQMLDWF